MKLILATLALLSLNASACPDFTGTYACVYKGHKSALAVTQAVQDGVTIYNFSDGAFVADGQTKLLTDGTALKGGAFKAWCDGDKSVSQEVSGHSWSEGAFYGDIDEVTVLTLNGTVMKQEMTGTMKNHGGTFRLSGEEVCTKIP